MSYITRTSGGRFRHDPAARGIFIHGGTCLMHDPGDSFATNARPNHFSLTFPLIDGHGWPHALDHPKQATFQRALAMAKRIRQSHPELRKSPVFACTDMIRDRSWSASTKVQQVA